MHAMRASIGCVLLIGMASCGEAPARKPPAEVPLQEYQVEGPTSAEGSPDANDDGGAAGASAKSGDAKEGSAAPAGKLDAKNGFAGAQLGAPFKSFHNLKQTERSGDHVTYRMTKGAPSYGGVTLKDVLYTFNKGKLDTISFSAKSSSDCKGLKDSLERELGAPQQSSAQASVWKGDKVGLRYATSANGSCTGAVVSRELADAISWAGLQP